jgi:sugar phosphate isomerase/epimerase
VSSPHVHIPFNKIEQYAQVLCDQKLNIEIYFSADVLDTAGIDVIEKTISVLDYSPSMSIHAPFMDLSPAAVDAKIREVTMFRFDQIMDVASVLKAKNVVFHSGYEKWKYALNIDIWLEKSLMTWDKVLEQAERADILISIENIFEDSPDNLRLLAENVDSGRFGLCFDTGHFNLFSRISLDEWISQTGRYINELHLHDNDGTSDAHISIGSGTFDFKRLFHLLNDRNDILRTVEAHSPEDASESLKELKKY